MHIHLLKDGKDIAAAKLLLERTQTKAKSLVLIVGSNDLARAKSVSACQVEMEELLSIARAKMPDAEITISQILPRTDREVFNRKSEDFNRRMSRHCDTTNKLHFITHDDLQGRENRYDGIHLEKHAVGKLVRNIKAVLNPLLGMVPYSEYSVDKSHHETPEDHATSRANHRHDQISWQHYNSQQDDQGRGVRKDSSDERGSATNSTQGPRSDKFDPSATPIDTKYRRSTTNNFGSRLQSESQLLQLIG